MMNGKRTLRISTVPEAQNHPILGMRFLPLFSSPLEPINTKEDICLEEMKIKVKKRIPRMG